MWREAEKSDTDQCFSAAVGTPHTWGAYWNPSSDLVGLGWSLRLFISNKLPGDAEATGPWTVLQTVRKQMITEEADQHSRVSNVRLNSLDFGIQWFGTLEVSKQGGPYHQTISVTDGQGNWVSEVRDFY